MKNRSLAKANLWLKNGTAIFNSLSMSFIELRSTNTGNLTYESELDLISPAGQTVTGGNFYFIPGYLLTLQYTMEHQIAFVFVVN